MPNTELTDSPLPLSVTEPEPVEPTPVVDVQVIEAVPTNGAVTNGTDLDWRPTEVTEITVRNGSNEVVEAAVRAGASPEHAAEVQP